jgi:N-acetylated-alpha-linked acidic dipeptidase
MITRSAVSLAALALALVSAPAAAQPGGQALEKNFDSMISTADQLGWLETMSSAPNHVGAPHNKANADMELALFRQWGWDAHIERFDVLYPTPISTTLELVTPARVQLGGQEPPIAEDPSSSRTADALPPYVAYQGDGDVTAPVVYLNYGMPDDYEALEQRGISVKGKIVLARYGGGWRGLKPKLAQEHGAIGCLIYSDPADGRYSSRPRPWTARIAATANRRTAPWLPPRRKATMPPTRRSAAIATSMIAPVVTLAPWSRRRLPSRRAREGRARAGRR